MWIFEIEDQKTLEKIDSENELLKEIHPLLKITCLTHDEVTGDLNAVTTFFPEKGHKDLPQRLKDEGWFQTDTLKKGRAKILFFSKLV